jgi:hypothetical protein
LALARAISANSDFSGIGSKGVRVKWSAHTSFIDPAASRNKLFGSLLQFNFERSRFVDSPARLHYARIDPHRNAYSC